MRDAGEAGPLVCVYEKGNEEGQGMFQDATGRMLEHSDLLQQEYNVQNIVFAPKERAGLAMADMLAWLWTHWVQELHVDDNFSRLVLEQIYAGGKVKLFRIRLDRQFLIEAALANTNARMLDLHRRYGFGITLSGEG